MSAVISACGRYRYRLTRGEGRLLAFVMLNPSVADAEQDDPTIRRCRAFATREGYQGIEVMNLYALRVTDPAALKDAPDREGPENIAYLADLGRDHSDGWIVCAWGANAEPADVAMAVAQLAACGAELVCLGTNKDGSPKHPLYLPGHTAFEDWSPRA